MKQLLPPPTPILRRRMLMKYSYYIQNGLVFWLDGINKGGHSGAWTDLVGGIVLTNNGCVFTTDGVIFDGASYLENDIDGPIGLVSQGATIEVCFEPESGGGNYQCIITQSTGDSVGFLSIGGSILVSTGDGKIYRERLVPGNKYTISGNQSKMILNGIESVNPIESGGNVNPSIKRISVGCWNPGYYQLVGTLHSIRIYNRQLTEAEMLSNQRIDNERFNLGLSI